MIEPPPALFHARRNCLRGEEQVPQIHRHALVPVFRRDVLDLVPIVVGGVVDQHGDRAGLGFDLGANARRSALMSVTSHLMNFTPPPSRLTSAFDSFSATSRKNTRDF